MQPVPFYDSGLRSSVCISPPRKASPCGGKPLLPISPGLCGRESVTTFWQIGGFKINLWVKISRGLKKDVVSLTLSVLSIFQMLANSLALFLIKVMTILLRNGSGWLEDLEKENQYTKTLSWFFIYLECKVV